MFPLYVPPMIYAMHTAWISWVIQIYYVSDVRSLVILVLRYI